MVEFLPHMEESIDLANYLQAHDQNFSNCNDLPSSLLLPSEAELLHIPTCSTFIDLSDLSDPTDAELYHFYIWASQLLERHILSQHLLHSLFGPPLPGLNKVITKEASALNIFEAGS